MYRCPVDIKTKEGANAFLEHIFCPGHAPSFVKEIRELQRKTQLNVDDEETLEGRYFVFNTLAENADKKIFREKIPQSEIQDWLDLVIEEIENITTKQSWISTGHLDNIDIRVLQSCDYMFTQVVPVYLAFKSKFFQVLANFVKARKEHGGRALPGVIICDYIGGIVHSALFTAIEHFENRWHREKILKKLEASGILEEFLRCYTVPDPVGLFVVDCWNPVLECLKSCPDILTRKFKIGKPCRDTLEAILDGRDGSRDIQHGVLNRLKGIGGLVEMMADTTESLNAELPFTTCDYCSKKGNSEAPLSVCAGCRSVGYCSKECQKADWEMHKGWCQNAAKHTAAFFMVVKKFAEQNPESILHTLDEKCRSTGAKAGDLAVEVDFMPNEEGIIPALHDPPIFRIVVVRDYISGQEMPEWLRGDKVEDHRRANFKDLVQRDMTEGGYTSAALLAHYASNDHFVPGYFEFS